MNYPTRQDVMDAIAKKQEQIHAQASAKAKADGHQSSSGLIGLNAQRARQV